VEQFANKIEAKEKVKMCSLKDRCKEGTMIEGKKATGN